MVGLTPSERVDVRAVVPISVNLVTFQYGVDLVEFLLAECDVDRREVFQDPRLVRGTGDRDDMGTCGVKLEHPSTLNFAKPA